MIEVNNALSELGEILYGMNQLLIEIVDKILSDLIFLKGHFTF